MGKVKGRFVILLDLNHALSMDELEVTAIEPDTPAAAQH